MQRLRNIVPPGGVWVLLKCPPAAKSKTVNPSASAFWFSPEALGGRETLTDV